MPPASVVLFDFGGVVIRTPFELLGQPWRGPFDPESDQLWRRFQDGDITERDYWNERAQSLHPDSPDPIIDLMNDAFDRPEAEVVRPEVESFIADCPLRVAALTNDLGRFHPPEWIERMSVIERFDPLIDLSFSGVLKPSREAYEVALRRLAVEPAEVVFVDDQPANVEGARSAGIHAVWFDVTDVEASLARVETSVRQA